MATFRPLRIGAYHIGHTASNSLLHLTRAVTITLLIYSDRITLTIHCYCYDQMLPLASSHLSALAIKIWPFPHPR